MTSARTNPRGWELDRSDPCRRRAASAPVTARTTQAQHEEAADAVPGEIADGMLRPQRRQHRAGMVGDLVRAEHAYHHEPDRHDRTEDLAQPASCRGSWKAKRSTRIRPGDGPRPPASARAQPPRALRPPRRRTEMSRRPDHPVARRAAPRRLDHQENNDADHAALGGTATREGAPARRRCRPHAVIVGAHDDGDVLERRHQRQRPEDQQKGHTENVGRAERAASRAVGAGVQRVEGLGADVAEDDSECRQTPGDQGHLVRGSSAVSDVTLN